MLGRARASTITIRATARILENVHLEGTVRGHRFESDEPPERGGTNQGPAPPEEVRKLIVRTTAALNGTPLEL